MSIKKFIVGVGVAFLAVTVGNGAVAADKSVRVINESDHTVLHVQATNTNDNSYGEDLNTGPIAPGESENIDLDDGAANCMYDIRALQRGGFSTHGRFNACKIATWTITN